MYLNLTDEQLRSICRSHIEALEKWARLILHYVLIDKFGPDYIHVKNPDDNYKFKKSLVTKSDNMIAEEPGRFSTHLDTLFLDELIYMLCHSEVYPLISPYIGNYCPKGVDALRSFLNCLIPIRNKLSHTNPFSYRDAQRAVCYSNDFIEAVKYYFEEKNMTKEFNVPTIIKVTDSFGNEVIPSDNEETVIFRLSAPSTKNPKVLYLGDQFSLTLEIDPSFQETDYHIDWHGKDGVEVLENGKKINVTINNKLIGENVMISCNIISNNEWHRYGKYDQSFILVFKAVPLPAV